MVNCKNANKAFKATVRHCKKEKKFQAFADLHTFLLITNTYTMLNTFYSFIIKPPY